MNETLLRELAESLAKRVNEVVNIPFVAEEDEQAFFELLILVLLRLILDRIGLEPEQLRKMNAASLPA